MGISETHWTGQEKLRIASGETILYSGREDDIHVHREVVGEKAIKDWTPISERLIKARFFSKYEKLKILHIYAKTKAAEDQQKDYFYTQL